MGKCGSQHPGMVAGKAGSLSWKVIKEQIEINGNPHGLWNPRACLQWWACSNKTTPLNLHKQCHQLGNKHSDAWDFKECLAQMTTSSYWHFEFSWQEVTSKERMNPVYFRIQSFQFSSVLLLAICSPCDFHLFWGPHFAHFFSKRSWYSKHRSKQKKM